MSERPTFAQVVAEGTLFAVSKPYQRTDRRSRSWVVEFRDALTDKEQKRCFRTQAEAWAFYNRNIDDREGLRTGTLTRRQVAMGLKGLTPIATAIDAYQASMTARQFDPLHTRSTHALLVKLAAFAGWAQVKDIGQGPVETFLAQYKNGMTRRVYHNRAMAFCRWLVKMDYLIENPLAKLDRPRLPEATLKKRALSDDEFNSLISCEDIAAHRRLWYWIAGRLGIRHRELARLKWEHVDFDRHVLVLPSDITKNHKPAELPINSKLMAAMVEARQAPATKMIRLSQRPNVTTWEWDLKRAGVALVTEAGKAVPSSLRVTYATALVKAGTTIPHLQKLMRHGDVNLTLRVYNRVKPSELADAAEKIA